MIDSMRDIVRMSGMGVQGFSEGKAESEQFLPKSSGERRALVQDCNFGVHDSTAEPLNHRSTEADTGGCAIAMDAPSTEGRETAKASFRDILSLESGVYADGEGYGFGGSVFQCLGDKDEEVTMEAEGEEPFRGLPAILKNYARCHANRNGLSSIGAVSSAVAGLSSAMGKGFYVITKRARVHPNLAILNCAPSSGGKKSFHESVDYVSRVLGKFEAESKTEARRSKARLTEVERKIRIVEDREGSSSKDGLELASLKASAERLRVQSTPRNLDFNQDSTAATIARSMVAPGQGGACVISAQEGSKFFSRFAGGSRNDSGYGTLLTQGFNDPSYKVSRVDEGELTHLETLEPRLCLTISIQNATVPAALGMIGEDLGVFQRMLFVVEERRMPPIENRSLFEGERGSDPFGNAYATLVRSIASRSWERSVEPIELTFSSEAMGRLDKLRYQNDCLAYEIESSAPKWAPYVGRWTEQVIKLVQVIHLAGCADPNSGAVDWTKVQKPISLSAVERTIELHDRWKLQTRRFYELWVAEQKTGIEKGLTIAKVTEKLNYLMTKKNVDGIPMSTLDSYLPGFNADEIRKFIEAHPDNFKITLSKARGAPLYSPVVNPADLIDLIEKGESREAA